MICQSPAVYSLCVLSEYVWTYLIIKKNSDTDLLPEDYKEDSSTLREARGMNA
jgi:hypothetical protein